MDTLHPIAKAKYVENSGIPCHDGLFSGKEIIPNIAEAAIPISAPITV